MGTSSARWRPCAFALRSFLRCRWNQKNRQPAAHLSSSVTSDSPPLSFFDVPYFVKDGVCDDKQKLDVYIPSGPFPRPKARTCLFVHGGSWQRGDRRHPVMPDHFYSNVGREMARAGFVGLIMSYRLAPAVQHPEQVRDVARAIRWAHDNVSRYGGDPEDLILVGHSAGAHLAALCLSDTRWLEDEGFAIAGSCQANIRDASDSRSVVMPKSSIPMQGRSNNPISGFVGISGVYDIPRMAGNVVGAMLASTVFGEDRRRWKDVSPVHRVRAAVIDADARKLYLDRQGPATDHIGREKAGLDERGAGSFELSSRCPKVRCPLADTNVLLINGSSDFHLQEDTASLAEALDDLVRASAMGEGQESKRSDEADTGTEKGAVMVASREKLEGTLKRLVADMRRGKKVHHILFEDEDHMSMVVSLGEQNMAVSKIVLEFMKRLPRLPPARRKRRKESSLE